MIRKNTRYFDHKLNRFVDSRASAIRRHDNTKMNKDMKRGLQGKIKSKHSPFPFRRFPNHTSSYKHSGDIGDLIYSLLVIRETGGGSLYLSTDGLGTKGDGTKSGFTIDTIKYVKPFLEAQPYITQVKEYGNERVTIDIDLFRKIDISAPNLCQKILGAFSIPFCHTDLPWIQCDSKKIAKAVFARSFRYRNNNVNYAPFVAEHKDNAVFVGLKSEYDDFVKLFGFLPFYKVANMLEMAEIINGSDLFYGNQSSPMALAVGLGKKYIQEVCVGSADCKFDRINATYLH
jgi:hypothetical protein